MAALIPVTAKGEPRSFDKKVRKPGLAWLKKNKIPLSAKPPISAKLPPCWRKCLGELHTSYSGVCAYLCVFVQRVTGGVSVDHYVAKSSQAGLAYDWDNYRLACSTMNARKRDFSNVLDPFTLAAGMFHLELVTGKVFPNPALTFTDTDAATATIKRLGLDNGQCRKMRARRFSDYLKFKLPAAYLKQHSPFIWLEAKRQGLL